MNNRCSIDLFYKYSNCNTLELENNFYMFDKKLKLLILNVLFDIEQKLKFEFTNNFINRYGDKKQDLINVNNYSKCIMTEDIINRVQKQINDYKISLNDEQKYILRYGYTPVGAYIKILSFGLLRDLYYISKSNDKDHICRKLTDEKISSRDLETILEVLAKARNMCCHNEVFFNYLNDENMIPTTKYHSYFKNNLVQYGKKDFLSILISIKLLSEKNNFDILIDDIYKLIDESVKDLAITKSQLLYLMHLPENYFILKNL